MTFILFLVFGPGLMEDAFRREEERKRREQEYEDNAPRDPEADARIRRHIGLPPRDSTEKRREP